MHILFLEDYEIAIYHKASDASNGNRYVHVNVKEILCYRWDINIIIDLLFPSLYAKHFVIFVENKVLE